MGRGKVGKRRSRARSARKKMAAQEKHRQIYIDGASLEWHRLLNIGRDDCACIALRQCEMLQTGVTQSEIDATTGELSDDFKTKIQLLREKIVAAGEGDLSYMIGHLDGDPAAVETECVNQDEVDAAEAEGRFVEKNLKERTFEQCFKNGTFQTLRMWKRVILAGGWLDYEAVCIGARLLDLRGFAIVEVKEGNLLYEKGYGYAIAGCSSMILYGAHHFEALYQVRRFRVVVRCIFSIDRVGFSSMILYAYSM